MDFLETIRFENQEIKNLKYHEARVTVTAGRDIWHQIEKTLDGIAPQLPHHRRIKCSITYNDHEIISLKTVVYQRKRIIRLIPIESDIDYRLKYADRRGLDIIKQQVSEGEEPMIIKNGLITDTTFSNLIFKNKEGEFFTPRQSLLCGTMRASLLDRQQIKERDIRVADLSDFVEAHIINAMNDIGDYIVTLNGTDFELQK